MFREEMQSVSIVFHYVLIVRSSRARICYSQSALNTRKGTDMTERPKPEIEMADRTEGVNENPVQSGSVTRPNAVRWKQVSLTAIGVFTLGTLIAGAIWYVSNIEPALHPVKGYVFLDGEPMDGGVISLQHSRGWPGALGAIGKDGRFELTTNGTFGAYEGTNQVFFSLMDGGFPPTSQLPSKYVDPENPPFTIQVDAATKDEDLRFELVGKLKKE